MAVTMAFKNVWTQNINYPYIHIFAALSQFGGNLGQRLSSTIVPPLPNFSVHREATAMTGFNIPGVLFLIANSDSRCHRAT
jgi:hypothetical protein